MMTYPWLEPARQQCDARFASGQMAHALLCCALPGLGAENLVQSLVQRLLCSTETACGSCRACVALAAGSHPDFWPLAPVDDKISIGVDQVRSLSASLCMRPRAGARQVALINPAHAMTPAAANALLKTLEEPAADTVLILYSERAGALLPTITSRCQRLNVQMPTRVDAKAWLLTQQSLPEQDAELALDLAGGAPLAALAVLQANGVSAFRAFTEQMQTLRLSELMPLGKAYAADSAQFLQFFEHHLLQLARRFAPTPAADALMINLGQIRANAARLRDLVGTGVRMELAISELLRQHAGLIRSLMKGVTHV
jgi:DNA polymerase III subunit delta'